MISARPGGAAVYMQLAARLRDDITSGRLEPGHRLPSETTLAQEYGLSRQTVRHAVGVLRAEGLVVAARGQGVFVREHAEVQDLVPAPGSTVTARMPTTQERTELDLDDGVPVFWVVGPDGAGEVFPGDRWRLRWPS